jgi:hypothetical protein
VTSRRRSLDSGAKPGALGERVAAVNRESDLTMLSDTAVSNDRIVLDDARRQGVPPGLDDDPTGYRESQ